MSKFNGKDVLERAEQILASGPLEDHNCSDFCPWCAIAQAKGQLDKEHGTEKNFLTLILNLDTELESDKPLMEARIALKEFNEVDPRDISQKRALEIIRKAKENCKNND